MAKKSALKLAEAKAERERRKILVHRGETAFYVTPAEKAGEQVEELELVDSFEPEDTGGENYRRTPVSDCSDLESGDRVLVSDDVHTITEVTTRQIVTNFGDKFRRSDGVEWGGGEKQITHKLEKR
jgi:hypothetical protein